MTNNRIGIVGSFLGAYHGFPPDHAEFLANRLSEEGYQVFRTSSYKNRLLRLVDIISSLYSWRNQVELVLINVYSGNAFGLADAASLAARIFGLPIIFMLHGGNLPEFTNQHPLWVKRVLKRGAGFVTPSDYLADAFKSLFEVKVISNVIDLDFYPYHFRNQVQPKLFWMRTFENIYNPEMAIKTLFQLKRDFPAAQLTMAGKDQGSLESVRALAKDLGLEADVRFVGFLDLTGKQQEFGSHDIFLNTNRVDNMPVSLLEVAACGLPIVATKVGGIPYLLAHEHTALLVPDDDVDAMVQAVKRLLNDTQLASRLSQNGRGIAQSSEWNSVKKKWDALIADVLDARK